MCRLCVTEIRWCAWAARTRYSGVFTPLIPSTASTHAPQDLRNTRTPPLTGAVTLGSRLPRILPQSDNRDTTLSPMHVPVTTLQWTNSEVTLALWCAIEGDEEVWTQPQPQPFISKCKLVFCLWVRVGMPIQYLVVSSHPAVPDPDPTG